MELVDNGYADFEEFKDLNEEELTNKIKERYDLVVDIQGDEPLINPSHIDEVINFHLKNIETQIEKIQDELDEWNHQTILP